MIRFTTKVFKMGLQLGKPCVIHISIACTKHMFARVFLPVHNACFTALQPVQHTNPTATEPSDDIGLHCMTLQADNMTLYDTTS
jgi:hypothetical protein